MNIEIGEIIKAQGIRGEVKVKPLVRDSLLFKSFKNVLVDTIPFKVNMCSIRQGFIYFSLDKVIDRNMAEALVGKKIRVSEDTLPKLKEGEYYVGELVGHKVYFDDNECIGSIESIENYGSADIITIKGDKIVRIPFLKKLGLKLNRFTGYIEIDKKTFMEVAVYED